MRVMYAPEIGLVLKFEEDEIPEGIELAEGMCELCEAEGEDCSEVRAVLEVAKGHKRYLQ